MHVPSEPLGQPAYRPADATIVCRAFPTGPIKAVALRARKHQQAGNLDRACVELFPRRCPSVARRLLSGHPR